MGKASSQTNLDSQTDRYFYTRHEGSIFRRSQQIGPVEEIKHASGWKPYKGDALDEFLYGTRISHDEAEA